MDVKKYLVSVGKEIQDSEARNEILLELKNHIKDQKEQYIIEGLSEAEAEQKAVMEMGDPFEVGSAMNNIYKYSFNWGRVFLFVSISLIMGVVRSIAGYFHIFGSQNSAMPDIARYIGIVLLVYGAVWVVAEDYLNKPLFYGRSQTGGSNANGPFIAALGVAGICHTFAHNVLLAFICACLILFEQLYILHLRFKREKEFLWIEGIAITDMTYSGTHYGSMGTICDTEESRNIRYKGKGEFSGKVYSIYSYSEIEKGYSVVVKALEGRKFIVEKMKKELI